MTLDDERRPWRDDERLAQMKADWDEQCLLESVEAEEAKWHRIMRQSAREIRETRYVERGWIEPACRGPHG